MNGKKQQQTLLAQGYAVLVIFLGFFLRVHRLASVPFGWHPDEATKALLARDVLAGEYFPAFFSAFTGREALYVYLEAGAFALLGEGIFAARLLSAFIGVLTSALTYTLGKYLFGGKVGVLAAAFLALSLWHLIASRNGYRAVIQPLVQLPVLLLFFRGWRQGGTRNYVPFVLGGLWLGLTQYTYTAARFFPLVILALVLAAAVSIPRIVWRQKWPLLAAALVSTAVFLPLGIHFLSHPADFYGRAAQISVFSPAWSGGEPWLRLWQSVKETARMFTVWGDINYRFNVAGQPVFGAIDGLLFYGGLLLALWRVIRRRRLKRLAYALLLLWLPIMLLPMTLSAESLPYYQRAIGTLPAVYLFPALALVAGLNVLGTGAARLNVGSRWPSVALSALTLTFFLWLSAGTFQDYFYAWHEAPRNDDDRRVAMVYAAGYLNREGAPENLYLSTQYPQHPTLALLAPQHFDDVQWFDATQSLPLPPPASEATYLFLLENRPQPRLLQQVPGLEEAHTGFDRFGRPVFEVYRWQHDSWPVPSRQGPAAWSWATSFEAGDPHELRQPIDVPVNFGDVLEYAGHERSAASLRAGDTLELVLYWRLLQKPDRQYTFFVHLLSPEGDVVAGYDANTYSTSFWREQGGEMLLSYFPLALPAGTEAGEYQVEIGVYHQPTGRRLPVRQDGQDVADRLLLVPVEVP
jgi:4-amino-4-deoxy-L-arabinose transferase-like glycosyltransferase